MTKTSKKAKIEHVKERISSDAEFSIRCMLLVAGADDGLRSGVGFRNCDSEIIHSYARQHRAKGSLSEKQMAVIRRIMPHYARQLVQRHIPAEWLEAEMATEEPTQATAEHARTSTGGRIEADGAIDGWAACRRTVGAPGLAVASAICQPHEL